MAGRAAKPLQSCCAGVGRAPTLSITPGISRFPARQSELTKTRMAVPVETELAEHHEIILNATQRCIERHRGRTMLFLPPGSAKSTYATVVASTWAVGSNLDSSDMRQLRQ